MTSPTSVGAFYSNFFEGVIVGGSVWQSVSSRQERAKNDAGIQSEVKWSKVSPYDVERYEILIREFFNVINEGQARMRIMFRQNIREPINLSLDHKKSEYFLLYYQFPKTWLWPAIHADASRRRPLALLSGPVA